ncbi:tRNA-dependent cyclodipeptide synthase [Streptomyces sp. NPDC051582]|uniref:tRNA-dependent cyclodipeptide synthase n=1 Tax=Streptomyces sp. NPDC051582 TaxID=3155167 RepID=UPI003414B73F
MVSVNPDITVRPLSATSEQLVKRADHVLLGLSPMNGYYKPRTVETLVAWASDGFKKVDVVLPGYEAAHTLVAAGFDAPEAVRHARRSVHRLRNAALRALERCGIEHPEHHVNVWTQLHNRSPYLAALQQARTAYDRDPVVRRACRQVTAAAIHHARGGGTRQAPPSEEQVDLAVGYVLAEVPLVTSSPAIFAADTSVFVYHRRMELVDILTSDQATALRPAAGQGHAIVTIQGEQP